MERPVKVQSATQAASQRSRLTLAFALVWQAVFLLASHAAQAQAPGHTVSAVGAELREKLAKPGDLALRNTSLRDALFTISDLWKVNLVVGDEVQGTVNGSFKSAPLSEILDAILLSNGYSYRAVGQSLVIMKLADLGELNPLFETATLPIGPGDPTEIVAGAELLASPRGKIKAIPSAGTLLVIDFPDRVERIRQLVHGIRGPGGINPQLQHLAVTHFCPQFVNATALKEALTAVLSPDGKIAILERENRVVCIDYPHNLRLGEEVLQRVDVPRPQVRITAYIYDVATEDMERLGINWNHAVKGRYNSAGEPQTLWGIDTLTTVPLDGGAVSGAMTFANMSKTFDLVAMVDALSTASNSRLLADPNIVVVDNEPAEIAIVQEIPYQQLTQTAMGGDIGTTAFREAGVKLTVTPRIAHDGTISMNVQPEFSRLTGYTPEDQQPIIDRRTARTQVRVVNGHTLVIGGLKNRADLGEFNGIPYLKDIPKIGFLFRGRSTTTRESELLVFIRPEIVTESEMHSEREAAAFQSSHTHLENIPAGEVCLPLPTVAEESPAEGEPVPAGEPIPLPMSGRQEGQLEFQRPQPTEPPPPEPVSWHPSRVQRLPLAIPLSTDNRPTAQRDTLRR